VFVLTTPPLSIPLTNFPAGEPVFFSILRSARRCFLVLIGAVSPNCLPSFLLDLVFPRVLFFPRISSVPATPSILRPSAASAGACPCIQPTAGALFSPRAPLCPSVRVTCLFAFRPGRRMGLNHRNSPFRRDFLLFSGS